MEFDVPIQLNEQPKLKEYVEKSIEEYREQREGDEKFVAEAGLGYGVANGNGAKAIKLLDPDQDDHIVPKVHSAIEGSLDLNIENEEGEGEMIALLLGLRIQFIGISAEGGPVLVGDVKSPAMRELAEVFIGAMEKKIEERDPEFSIDGELVAYLINPLMKYGMPGDDYEDMEYFGEFYEQLIELITEQIQKNPNYIGFRGIKDIRKALKKSPTLINAISAKAMEIASTQ